MSATHATQLRNHWWWRPGWNADRRFYTWHLTFDGQHQLHQLVTTYQQALHDVPGLDLIPLRWLHLTMQGVGFTDQVHPDQARAIVDAVGERLAGLSPVELVFHHPAIRPEALALPPIPAQALAGIRNTVREGIAAVWDTTRVPEDGSRFEPHISMAYVNKDGPGAAALRALAGVNPEPVQVAVCEVSLIVLRRDERLYRWETFATAPLGAT